MAFHFKKLFERKRIGTGVGKLSAWGRKQRMAFQNKTSPSSRFGRFVRFYNRNRTIILDILIPVLMVLIALIIALNVRTSSRTGNYGIDVSQHQGKIKWSTVSDDGVTFAVIRCGYRAYSTGKVYEDSQFKRNMRNAKAVGIRRGVYFYSQATTVKEAREEAAYVLKWLNGAKLDYPVYIDIEDTESNGQGRADGLTVAERTAAVKAFCAAIEEGGYDAGIYSNIYYLTSMMDLSQLSSYSVWVAHYVDGSDPQYDGDYDLWQYSATGTVAGIDGYVDLDRYVPILSKQS